MPTSDSLERVGRIVETLAPLGQLGPGSPLRSGDWNALVAGVLDLARLALARDEVAPEAFENRFALRDHLHLGQVDRSWFDPATAALIDQASTGPELRADVRALKDAVASLRSDLDAARADLRKLQLTVDGMVDVQTQQSGAADRLSQRVETLQDVRTDVAKIDGRFIDLGGKLDKALAFQSRLVDANGQPIDIAATAAQVKDLSTLRDNLKDAAGNVVRYRDFEKRVADIEGAAVTKKDLRASIEDEVKSDEVVAAVSEAVLGVAGHYTDVKVAEASAAVATLGAGLTGVQSRLDAQDSSLLGLAQRVGTNEAQLGRVGALSGQVDSLGSRMNAAEGRLQAHGAALSTLTPLTDRMGAIEGRVDGIESVASRVPNIETAVANLGQLTDRIAPLETRLTAVETIRGDFQLLLPRVGALESSAATLRRDTDGLTTRVTVVESVGDDNTRRVTNVERDLSTVSATVRQTATSLGTLTSTVSGLSTTITAVSNRETGLVTTVTGLGTRVGDLTNRVSGLNTSVTDLARRVPSTNAGGTVIAGGVLTHGGAFGTGGTG